MKRIFTLFIALLLCSIIGCSEKPIEKIFVIANTRNIFTGKITSDGKWEQVDVIEKCGTMWKIRFDDGDIEWLDILDKKYTWRK